MSKRASWFLLLALLGTPVAAQNGEGESPQGVEAEAPARPKPSEAARAALAVAKGLADRVKEVDGDARLQALQAAAESYDRITTEYAAEPTVAAQAAFTAGGLWRRHGSMALAERSYLAATRLDPARYGQRGLLEAAGAQRRQDRFEDALKTYVAAAAAEPATARAQEARLWQGRLLQQLGRVEEAIDRFRASLETASTPRQVIDTCNELARVLIQQGDLDGAGNAIAHADRAVQKAMQEDQGSAESLERALTAMSSRKALQRALDKRNDAAKDAERLEQHPGK